MALQAAILSIQRATTAVQPVWWLQVDEEEYKCSVTGLRSGKFFALANYFVNMGRDK